MLEKESYAYIKKLPPIDVPKKEPNNRSKSRYPEVSASNIKLSFLLKLCVKFLFFSSLNKDKNFILKINLRLRVSEMKYMR